MSGYKLPALSESDIQVAFENPIGTPRIRDLAIGKQRVVILFDDLARPTPTYTILPFVIQELKAGGIGDEQISLVCAYGCHRPLTRDEMIKKLGREIVEKYPVFNHNLYEHHKKIGTTSMGRPCLSIERLQRVILK
jgi:nickel-dependent lactate racemase